MTGIIAMSMIYMQTTIARLCVDQPFREAFLRDPDSTLEPFDLTVEERESIKALDMEAVGEYASGLLGKRIGIIKKWFRLPWLFLEARLPAPALGRVFRRFGVEEIRDSDEMGGEWVRSEFDRFHKYLQDLVSSKEIDLPGFSDLLEFEATRFSMALDPELSSIAAEFGRAIMASDTAFTREFQDNFSPLLGKHARILSFNHNVADLVTILEEGMPIPELEEEPTVVLFFKRPQELKVDTSLINLPLRTLLEMCTGEWSTSNVVSSVISQYGALLDVPEEDLREDCLAVLKQLHLAGAIRFCEPTGKSS
jgi:hypothetical protein